MEILSDLCEVRRSSPLAECVPAREAQFYLSYICVLTCDVHICIYLHVSSHGHVRKSVWSSRPRTVRQSSRTASNPGVAFSLSDSQAPGMIQCHGHASLVSSVLVRMIAMTARWVANRLQMLSS